MEDGRRLCPLSFISPVSEQEHISCLHDTGRYL